MKDIPLPQTMIVQQKIHMGKYRYKLKAFRGIIRSVQDEIIDVQVNQHVRQHFVIILAYLDYSFKCNRCGNWKDWQYPMVMN